MSSGNKSVNMVQRLGSRKYVSEATWTQPRDFPWHTRHWAHRLRNPIQSQSHDRDRASYTASGFAIIGREVGRKEMRKAELARNQPDLELQPVTDLPDNTREQK